MVTRLSTSNSKSPQHARLRLPLPPRVVDAIRKHYSSELEQGFIRVVITGSLMIYLIIKRPGDAAALSHCWHSVALVSVFLALSCGLIVAMLIYPRCVKAQRMAGALLDTGGISALMCLVPELAMPYWWVYLWITVGNGFRFGVGMLFVSAVSSIIGFWIVSLANPYWSQHEQIAYGMMLCLIIIPSYVGVLLRRLQAQTQRAEEASRAKTLFLANVSHELRTPLQTIILQTQLLVCKQQESTLCDGLKVVMRSANQMLDLVTQLLDLAKSESTEKIHIVYETIDVRSFMDDTLEAIRPILRGDNTLTLCYDGDPKTIVCSGPRLRQMIVNLVQNADKFTHAGTIEIALSRDSVPSNLLLSVSDTGCGMAPEVRERIFDAFYQDATREHDGQGIGIGLWVTNGIVHALGGTIDVDSTPGVGTRFEIRFALEPKHFIAASHSAVDHASHQCAPAELHILFAEDDHIIRSSMMIFLHEEAIHVDECPNGRVAAEFIRERGENYDAIVLDHRMPGVSGGALLKQIREEQTLDVPVILLTGDENEDLVALCAAHNAIMLYKPVQPKMLIDTLRQAAAKHRRGRQCDPVGTSESPR